MNENIPLMRAVKVCPNCQSRDIQKIKIRRIYRCRKCKHNFSNPIIKTVSDHRKTLPVPHNLRPYVKGTLV